MQSTTPITSPLQRCVIFTISPNRGSSDQIQAIDIWSLGTRVILEPFLRSRGDGEIKKKFRTMIEPTCAYARWALMHRFLYVCLDVTWPKFRMVCSWQLFILSLLFNRFSIPMYYVQCLLKSIQQAGGLTSTSSCIFFFFESGLEYKLSVDRKKKKDIFNWHNGKKAQSDSVFMHYLGLMQFDK